MVGLMQTACLAGQGAQTTAVRAGSGAPFDFDGLAAAVEEIEAEEVPAAVTAPAPVPLAAPPDVEAVAHYVLRTSPPDVLIAYAFRHEPPAVIEKAMQIACREGGMGKGPGRTWQVACAPHNRRPTVPYDPSCGADNPTSSASGLVQFIDDWAGWGGYDWVRIVDRDCWEDAQMFYAAYKANGWGPWE